MTLDEQIAILQALKDGKKIEARVARTADWKPWKSSEPCNFHCFEYRIVPEPRRWIIHRYGNGPALYAVPYGYELPAAAAIICLATEDINLGEAATPYLEALKEKISRP